MCIFCSMAGISPGGPACTDLPQVTDPANDTTNGAGAPVVNAAPAFSLAQIVQQLRTQWGGSFEGTTESWSGSGPINYYIGGTPYPSGSGEIAYKTSMTQLMVSRAVLAFELWDDLIARDLNPTSTAAFGQIQFEYATNTQGPGGGLTTGGGTYSFPWIAAGGASSYGTANYNMTRDEIWLNSHWTSHDQDSDMYLGGYGFETYMHEIGHSLGLSHPGTYDAGNGGTITYANNAEYAQDNRQYTVMSYFGGYLPGSGWQQDGTFSNYLYSSTPMLHDVAAIQAIYGADMSTRIGDTTYGFHVSTGVPDVFNFAIDTSPIVTVWDAGGNDTLDLSGYSANQHIDLRAGTYSDVGGMLSNFAIAYNVTIENAIGGSGNDTLVGNDANNTLRGGPGNDTVDGGPGTDTAVFSGLRSAYTITPFGSTFQVTGTDGTDTLTNVELARFDDTTITLTPGPPVTHDFTGTPGNDTFTALPGNGRIDALGGVDTIIFGFKLTDASVTFAGNQVIVDTATSHLVLTGFETYVFTDGTVNNNDSDPLVDDLFYYSHYHDVWNAHADADLHYHGSGWHEGRNPDAFFDTQFYLSLYPAAGADPLIQFDQSGWAAGRIPSPAFDPAQYLSHYPDVAAAHIDPLAHFLQNGAQEGRQPFAATALLAPNGFDYIYYLQHYPDVAAAHVDPFLHFQTSGWKEGRNPNALFDTNGYLATYTDVAAAHVNPLDHYHNNGWLEGRDPSINFDTTSYLAAYGDVAAAHVDPLAHFLANGIHEGRSPFADGVWG
jgi:Peptidase M10 serralysin C terminal